MGYQKREWQEIDEVLEKFEQKTGESRVIYREFIKEDIGIEKRNDLLTDCLCINIYSMYRRE